jgi:uncharacterized repeat protein (TIGR03803 family)
MTKFHGWKGVPALFLLCAATVISSPAQTTFTTLANFAGTNGANPGFMSLVQGLDGHFYGTTEEGGDLACSASPTFGCGTVFKVTAGGTVTTLYSFCSQTNCPDGTFPYGGLVQASNGNFYGTTELGGANGGGTVFEITPAGALTTLYSFSGSDGLYPYAGLVQAANGNFYGTTSGGSTNYGTVFEITPAGTLTTLHSFDENHNEGGEPYAALTQATNGSFYGTTYTGGTRPPSDYGTVFEITAGGTLTTLYSFCFQTNCADGANPLAGLVQASDGNLYGTTYAGGAVCGCYGTVFKFTGSTVSTLHSFDKNDGESPYGGLVQATNGDFYGTTRYGGTNGDGTVFSLSVRLGAFVKTLPASGMVGSAVTILGNNLAGATAVIFNGTAATFTVVRDSEISSTVPAGATTGKVEVTTPTKTLKSNVAFRVP